MNRQTPGLARSSLALLGSQYGLAVIGVGLTMVTLRLLSKEQFAVVATLEILTAVLAFSDPGLNAVVVQRAPSGLQAGGDRGEALGLIRVALVVRLALLGVLGAGCELLAPQISRLILKDSGHVMEIRLLVPGAILLATWESLRTVAQAGSEFACIARWNLLGGAARQVVAILFFLRFGFIGYLAGLVGALALVNAGMAWELRPYLFSRASATPVGALLRYGFPFWLRRLCRFGFLQFDLAAVGAMLQPEALALYGVARRLAGYVTQITESVQTPILVRAASLREESTAERGAFARKAGRYVSLLIVPIGLLVAAASPWLMRLFGGDKYAAGWPVLSLLAVGQVCYALFGNQAIFLFVLRSPWATLLLDGLSGIVSFGSVPLLILSLGVGAAGLGQILGLSAGLALARLLLRRHPEIPFDWEALRSLLWPVSAATLVLVAGQLLYLRLWSVPFYGIVALALFALLLRGRLAPEEKRQLLQSLPTRLVGWARLNGRAA